MDILSLTIKQLQFTFKFFFFMWKFKLLAYWFYLLSLSYCRVSALSFFQFYSFFFNLCHFFNKFVSFFQFLKLVLLFKIFVRNYSLIVEFSSNATLHNSSTFAVVKNIPLSPLGCSKLAHARTIKWSIADRATAYRVSILQFMPD